MSACGKRVAIVEDERRLREMLEMSLAREGFETRSAVDGAAALALVRAWEPDVVLLDLGLPKMDGIALLPHIRDWTEAPVIVLTARDGERDQLDAFARGADDYVIKPFKLELLLARISAALRRPKLAQTKALRFADLHVDLEAREVRRGGELVALTRREYELLVTLVRTPRRVFSKDELLELVWGNDFEGTTNAVELYISYLRNKLDAKWDEKLIHTVRGAGYVLREGT